MVALVLSLGVTSAFAANDGSVTISNTMQGKEYKIYKVFDATYDGDNVSYFYDGSNATFLAALQDEDSPFTLTGPVGGVYNVIPKNVVDSVIIDFIKGQAENFGNAVATKTGTGGALTFNGLAYGYYYITSEVGAVVTINSALKDVTVIDKNQGSTLDKQEQIANQGYYVDENGHKVENPIPTANVGDTVSYKVVGIITQYQGEKKVVAFKWTDTMSAGLTADRNVQIKINGNVISNATITYSPETAGSPATVTTITVPTVDAEGNFLYGSQAEYEITYTAKINEAAITRDEENNTVDMDFTEDNTNWQDVDNDETKVKDYQITLTKQDATTKAKLAGAEFDLYDAATAGNLIPVVLVPNTDAGDNYGTAESTVNNVYRHAKEGETGVKMVVGKTGIIEIKGLANGSYYFDETKAPDGYNKLTARTEAVTITNANATIDVDNNTGATLPSTGGIGTTIFYAVGGVLVLAAVVLLVTKKRMSE